jgi:alcohol dehydrogenase (cytochrome c)
VLLNQEKRMKRRLLAALFIGSFTAAASAQTSSLPTTRSVTPERLAAAEKENDNWLGYGRDLGAHRYGTATEITRANVSKLRVAWTRPLGVPSSLEGTPVENDGVLYVTTGKTNVFAFNAKTGEQLWKYAYPLPAGAGAEACCNYDNRGATLYKGLVVTETLDAHLVALDARTGRVRWNTTVAPYTEGYSITSPPLVVKDKLVTGVAGGEYGIRGFVAAYDGDTGKLAWKDYTVPVAGQPAAATWNKAGALSRPGGPTWIQGSFDPGLNSVFWGVGNPTPDWDANDNKGSLLYTDSLLSLDADTGKMKWYHQYIAHDIWDFDGVNEPVIVDYSAGGKAVKAVVVASRDGYAYMIDRVRGKVIWAIPFVDKINWGTVDRSTGNISLNAAQQKVAYAMKPYLLCPNSFGGKNWEPTAYDPDKHLWFIPVIEGCDTIAPHHGTFKRGVMDLGGFPTAAKDSEHGSVVAIDVTSGKIAWKKHFRSPQDGGALVTAGGLVFSSDPQGRLRALDENNGNVLWQSSPTVSGLNAPAMTYTVDGRQFVAVLSGTGGAFPLYYPASTSWLRNVPNGARLYVYGVGSAVTAQR